MTRPPSWRERNKPIIFDLHKRGWSYHQIAKELKCGTKIIQELLEVAKAEEQPKREASKRKPGRPPKPPTPMPPPVESFAEPEPVESNVEPTEAQPVKPPTLDDAIREANAQLLEQREEMKRARVAGDSNAYNRAARLVISATQLLGRLCAKEDRKGTFVSDDEIQSAKAQLREKLGRYLK
jgi:hypothetical protein